MALPKLNTPTYELEIPSTDEKISYRPFLVKEEKILLLAMESGKNEDIIQAVKDIVSECTFNKVNVGVLPMFDIEYIFLQLRSKSVGETIDIQVKCPDDNKTRVTQSINLEEIGVNMKIGHTNEIAITKEVKMQNHVFSWDTTKWSIDTEKEGSLKNANKLVLMV